MRQGLDSLLSEGLAPDMHTHSPVFVVGSRLALPVWDWTEIGRHSGAFTLRLMVSERYAIQRHEPIG